MFLCVRCAADDPKKGPATLRNWFAELAHPVDAFSAIEYLGVCKNPSSPPPLLHAAANEFTQLRERVVQMLRTSSYRQPRRIDTVFKMLVVRSRLCCVTCSTRRVLPSSLFLVS